MNQHEFETYLDTQNTGKGAEPVGRLVEDSFGLMQRVVLPKTYWQFVDWAADIEQEDMVAWIKRCDQFRTDCTLSENLMEWLHWDMCDRLRQGHKYPKFLAKPDGFQE